MPALKQEYTYNVTLRMSEYCVWWSSLVLKKSNLTVKQSS